MRKLRYKDEECLKITLGQSHPFQFEYEAPSLSVLRLALRFSHMKLFPVFSTLASSCVPASVPAVPAAWNVVDPSFTQLTPTHPLRLIPNHVRTQHSLDKASHFHLCAYLSCYRTCCLIYLLKYFFWSCHWILVSRPLPPSSHSGSAQVVWK